MKPDCECNFASHSQRHTDRHKRMMWHRVAFSTCTPLRPQRFTTHRWSSRGLSTRIQRGVDALQRSAQFQARLHAQLAAFASEPSWRFIHLPLLSRSSDLRVVEQMTTGMPLEVEHLPHEGRTRVRKTSRVQREDAQQTLLSACDLFGPRPLAMLLAEPLDLHPQDGTAAAGARNVSLLVRVLAQHGRVGPMLEALDEATSTSAALFGCQLSLNAAVAAAMRALIRRGQLQGAAEVYDTSVLSGMQPNSSTLLQLCVAADRSRGESRVRASILAVERTAGEIEAGARLEPQCVDAYLDCCARASACELAVDAFASGLDGYEGEGVEEAESVAAAAAGPAGPGPMGRGFASLLRSHVLPKRARRTGQGRQTSSRHDQQRRRLCAVLTACARAGNLSGAQQALRLASSHGMQVDVPCVNAWIGVLGRVRPSRAHEAAQVLSAVLRQGGAQPSASCAPPEPPPENEDARVWLPPASAVRSAAVDQRVAKADRMVAGGAPLEPEDLRDMLNVALGACGRRQELAFALLRDAASFGVVPDAVGLTSAIMSCGEYVQPAVGGRGEYVQPAVGGRGEYVHPAVGGRGEDVHPAVGGRGEYVHPAVGCRGEYVHPAVGGGQRAPRESGSHAAFLAPTTEPERSLWGEEQSAAAVLVRWGLVELGIRPDARCLEACARGLPPAVVDELLHAASVQGPASQAGSWRKARGDGVPDVPDDRHGSDGPDPLHEGAHGRGRMAMAASEAASAWGSDDANAAAETAEAVDAPVPPRSLAAGTKLAYMSLLRRRGARDGGQAPRGGARDGGQPPRGDLRRATSSRAGLAVDDDDDDDDDEEEEKQLHAGPPQAPPTAVKPLLVRVEAIAAKYGLQHRAAELLQAVVTSMRDRRR